MNKIDHHNLHKYKAEHDLLHRPNTIHCQLALSARNEEAHALQHRLLAILLNQDPVVLSDRIEEYWVYFYKLTAHEDVEFKSPVQSGFFCLFWKKTGLDCFGKPGDGSWTA